MAGNNDADWIFSIGCADGSRRGGLSQRASLLCIRSGFAKRNLKESRPRALLERSSDGFDRHRKTLKLASKVGVKFGFCETQDLVIIGFSPCLIQERHVLPVAQMHLR
jgi:hypothetical protein